MGRPANGVPYLKGGVYHIRFKGDKEATTLDTRNANEAKRKARDVAAKRGQVSNLRESAAPKAPSGAAAPRTVTFGEPAATLPTFAGGDVLDSWLGSDSEFEGGQSSESASESPSVSRAPSEAMAVAPNKVGLTSEDTSRLHGLLSGIVGRANVLALGLGIRIFGRVPAEPEPADMELLNKAWQLQLDELLEGKEIKPYMLIIGASVGLGVGMYAGGEPIPKKVKSNDGTAQPVS